MPRILADSARVITQRQNPRLSPRQVSFVSEHFVDISPLRMVWSRPTTVGGTASIGSASHEPRVWAESVEGSSSDEWPPGPVFQDLFVEPKADGAVEFQLMGQCGKTIYTAAVLCDPPRGRIEFDVCARVRREPPSPGLVSTYRCEPPVHIAGVPDSRTAIRRQRRNRRGRTTRPRRPTLDRRPLPSADGRLRTRYPLSLALCRRLPMTHRVTARFRGLALPDPSLTTLFFADLP